MKVSTALKAAAAIAACLLLFSCKKEEKVTELSVSSRAVSFTADAGEQTVTITSNSSWTAASTASWFTVSPTSGSGDGSFKIAVGANDGFEVRSADVTVTAGDKTQTVKVSQLAQTPSLDVSPASFDVEHPGLKDAELTITSNAPWTLTIPSDCDWITADKTEGTGTTVVKLTVLANVLRETRSAVLTVKETVGGNQKEVSVSQEMGPRSRLTDSLALVAFYNATDGANWKADRVWDLTKPMDDTDAKWYGVTLDEEGRVTALKLMKGTITAAWTMPAAISELTELTELRFVDCQLTGEFPESLYGLTKLEVLFLTNNKLSGQLSDKISQWKDIEQIYIDQNPDLGGSLPKEIGQLTKLNNLNIAKTAISGTIPAEIKGCTALKNFMAYSTSITGIPDVWDQLPALELIQLYSNKGLTGEIPASMGKCAKIKNIWLYDCNLTGNVPETFANLPTSCIGLRIQDNKLSGVVPAAVKAHANWTRWKADQYIFPQQEGYGLE